MRYLSSIVLGLIIGLPGISAQVKWESEHNISNTSAWSYVGYNNARCIATSVDTVHVVWGEGAAIPSIRYTRSLDDGTTWGEGITLSTSTTGADYPSVAVSGSTVHAVWRDTRDGNQEIYYRRSNDNGQSWGDEVRLTFNPAEKNLPSIAVSGEIVHVVWHDSRQGDLVIYYLRSDDNGQTWGDDIKLNESTEAGFPSITAEGDDVYAVWQDTRDDNLEIYFKHSADNGLNWEPDRRLTDAQGNSINPSLEPDGSVLHLAWIDERDNPFLNYEIYYKNSKDAGATWSEDRRLTEATGHSFNPSIETRDSSVFVAWHDLRDGIEEIYFTESADLGATWSADTNLSNNAVTSYSPFLALTDSNLHLIWHDNRSGNHEIYYKRGKLPEKEPGWVDEEPDLNSLKLDVFGKTLHYTLPKACHVSLTLYDANGRRVQTLVSRNQSAGNHTMQWNATSVPPGVYFFNLRAGEATLTLKMVQLG